MAAFALMMLLTGCEGGDRRGAAGGDGSQTVITWLATSITQDVNDPRQVLIDAFEKGHPSIRVNLISGPTSTDAVRDTLRSRLADPASAGVPDVYLGDLIWPAAFAQDHLALPLSQHLPRDFWDRFVPGLVEGATYRGNIYAAPFFRDQGLLYYRQDLLQQAGLPVPATWEQLVDEATTIQARGLVDYGFVWTGAAYEGLTCIWMEIMADAGGQVLSPDGKRSAIDSPQSLEALRFLHSLLAEIPPVTPRDVANFQEPQVTDAFIHLHAAFARNWNALYTATQTAGALDKVGVTSLPTFAGRRQPGYSTAGGWDLYVNPRTTHLAAALEFIKWMTDVDAQEIMARQYHDISVNARVQDEPSVQADSPVLRAAARTTVVARPAQTPAYPAVSRAIYTNVQAAVTGVRTPEDALRAAGAQIDAALTRGSP